MALFSTLRPALHLLPPEAAHRLGILALRNGLLPATPLPHYSALETTALGLRFAHPLGLAAGFDKNAEAYGALLRQGFSFVETGTVTPLPQPGNPQPRLFRLPQDGAVINRLGFNNAGIETFVANLSGRDKTRGVVGANIGKNKLSEVAIDDYAAAMRAVYPHADYITVNISSPNTEGLRALQKRDSLESLLAALIDLRRQCVEAGGAHVPLLVKIAPDLGAQEKADIAAVITTHAIDGLIVSNTTIARPPTLKNRHARQQGGLSGRPLFAPSTQMLADMYRLTEGKILLVGVGGIASAADAYAKIRAGATLLQLYTALVYQGFGVVRAICDGLEKRLARDGFSHVSQAVGADVKGA
jgi:dihydroorotate dehydrogenase